MDNTERWMPVVGWPYDVSSYGRVRSNGGRRGAIVGRILKPQGGRYQSVWVKDKPRDRPVMVHILVLEAFHGPRPTPSHQCNHKNGIKTDNSSENVEWCTPSENMRHAFATGLNIAGPKNVKLDVARVPLIRSRWSAGAAITDPAAEYGVDRSTIGLLVHRKTWAHIP